MVFLGIKPTIQGIKQYQVMAFQCCIKPIITFEFCISKTIVQAYSILSTKAIRPLGLLFTNPMCVGRVCRIAWFLGLPKSQSDHTRRRELMSPNLTRLGGLRRSQACLPDRRKTLEILVRGQELHILISQDLVFFYCY